MKRIFAVLACLFAAQVYGQTLGPAPEDKSVIYIVRRSSLGFAINFTYFDGDKVIGKWAGPKYMKYVCDPGKRLLWARSENKGFIEVETEAGKNYIIQSEPSWGAVKAGVSFMPLDPSNEMNEKEIKKVLAFVTTRKPITFTQAQLDKLQYKMGDVIERGTTEYKEGKANQVTYGRLYPEMSFE